MRGLLGTLGMFIGGWIGWWLGSQWDVIPGLFLSLFGSAAGLYYGRRVFYDYFG